MYETEWAIESDKNDSDKSPMEIIIIKRPDGAPVWTDYIQKVAPVIWQEHCVECAAPECYSTCRLYRQRADGQCRLLSNGMQIRRDVDGLLGYGAEIRFEGWAKIQALIPPTRPLLGLNLAPLVPSRLLDKLTYSLTGGRFKGRSIMSKLAALDDLFNGESAPTAFLYSVLNEESEPVNMILEVSTDTHLKFRTSILCNPGFTLRRIPYDSLCITNDEIHRITTYPENTNNGKSLVFLALDFVTEKPGRVIEGSPCHCVTSPSKRGTKKAPLLKASLLEGGVSEADGGSPQKIKCLVWDLDNTLWDGILIESEEVHINQKAVDIIKELDKRGIINSIASKNDHDAAWAKIESLGLSDYFVMPQISWNPKSASVKQIAADMNIGIDTFAFIDDSDFERAEVSSACPDVLCIDAVNMDQILQMPQFDVMITEDSKNRRQTYKMLEKQKKESSAWNGDIDAFLRSCEMKLTVGKPFEEELTRCFELIQRTNQLNASGRRLTMDEIRALWDDPGYETYILMCQDRFGSYGLVGFSIVKLNTPVGTPLAGVQSPKTGTIPIPTELELFNKSNIFGPCITDFVISCRVANKKVEHAFFSFLAKRYKSRGCKKLWINYRKSAKNGAIFKVVGEIGMCKGELLHIENDIESYYLPLDNPIEDHDIVEVMERD